VLILPAKKANQDINPSTLPFTFTSFHQTLHDHPMTATWRFSHLDQQEGVGCDSMTCLDNV